MRKTKGATKSALCQKYAGIESPADGGLHCIDGRFASRFLGDLLILPAAAGWDLACARFSQEQVNLAAVAKLWAERRAGELLIDSRENGQRKAARLQTSAMSR